MDPKIGWAAFWLSATGLGALGIVACGSVRPQANTTQEATLEFVILETEIRAQRDTSYLSGSGDGQLTVSGVIRTPNPCYSLDAEVDADADSVTLRVTATPQPRICASVVAAFPYTATVGGLKGGAYTVNVLYTYPATGWDDVGFRLRAQVN